MGISIIIPLHNPCISLLKRIKKSILNQDIKEKLEIIEINHGWGLAKSLNYGIKKSKYSYIVSIHQDCIPHSKDWLRKLVEPLKKGSFVASTSRIIDDENKIEYTPALDEKGCGYKKQALIRVGLFDENTFLNSGEDLDIYLKLKGIGKIAYPPVKIIHFHKGYLINKSKYKKMQNANTWGCLFRKWGFGLPGWWKAVILANPFNFGYFYWFWRAFITKKQDIKK